MPRPNGYLLSKLCDYIEGSSLTEEEYFLALSDTEEDRCHHAPPKLRQLSKSALNDVLYSSFLGLLLPHPSLSTQHRVTAHQLYTG